jgi:hypothetical protein
MLLDEVISNIEDSEKVSRRQVVRILFFVGNLLFHIAGCPINTFFQLGWVNSLPNSASLRIIPGEGTYQNVIFELVCIVL